MCGLFCGKHWAYTSDSVFFYSVSRFLSSDYAFQVYVREQFEELKGGGGGGGGGTGNPKMKSKQQNN